MAQLRLLDEQVVGPNRDRLGACRLGNLGPDQSLDVVYASLEMSAGKHTIHRVRGEHNWHGVGRAMSVTVP